MYISIYIYWEGVVYTWWCLELIFAKIWEPNGVPEIRPGWATCKAGTLPLIYPLILV